MRRAGADPATPSPSQVNKAGKILRAWARGELVESSAQDRALETLLAFRAAHRQPLTKATMQDIGGCRSVLGSADEVRRVAKRLTKRRPPVRVNDYTSDPRSSGYRGLHIVVEYDERKIEVQLRTRVMHEWAITVERLGGRIQADLKSGIGPPEVLALLEAISEAMAIEEAAGVVDTALVDRINRLRESAVPFLGGGHK